MINDDDDDEQDAASEKNNINLKKHYTLPFTEWQWTRVILK